MPRRAVAAPLAALPLAALTLAFCAAGCASSTGDPAWDACDAAEAACRAQCDADFEANPSTWDYQSCLASCEPKPGAVCR